MTGHLLFCLYTINLCKSHAPTYSKLSDSIHGKTQLYW